MTNQFKAACKNVGLPPTKRQWRKWQRKIGLAWKQRSLACNGDLAYAKENL